MRISVTPEEAHLLDVLGEQGYDTAAFYRAFRSAIDEGREHPLTTAAARVESASFETPVERGEIPAPQAEF